MRLELQPIASAFHAGDWLDLVQLHALYNGVCAADDLEWDDDSLLSSLIEQAESPAVRADYEGEPQLAIQIAKDRFLSDLLELLRERSALLGDQSPFEGAHDANILIRRRSVGQVSPAGLGYAWLVTFWAISSKCDYLIISKEDRDRFIRYFAQVFEYICCLMMAGRSEGLVWHFGDSRDVREFLRRLTGVCVGVGTGAVKTHADLQQNQVGANDGGIDVIAVTTRSGRVQRDATAFMVGATIQQSDRRNKIIGTDQIRRFTDYFSRIPSMAFSGVLAIPFPAAEAERLTCRDHNCLYITKDELLQNLARFPSEPERRNQVARPIRKMVRESRKLQSQSRLVTRSGEHAIAWGN